MQTRSAFGSELDMTEVKEGGQGRSRDTYDSGGLVGERRIRCESRDQGQVNSLISALIKTRATADSQTYRQRETKRGSAGRGVV